MSKLEEFDTHEAAYDAAADAIADALRFGVASNDQAVFAGSGGSTPGAVYERLSIRTDVPWEKVDITLADERRSPPEDEKDNARLLKTTLLKNAAATARFTPLTGPDCLSGLPAAMDSILLGMGGDGHFASIFPDGDGMGTALEGADTAVTGTTPAPLPPGAPYRRWTLTLPVIARAKSVILLITGGEKRAVFDRAQTAGPVAELPVRALLQHPQMPLRVIWAE